MSLASGGPEEADPASIGSVKSQNGPLTAGKTRESELKAVLEKAKVALESYESERCREKNLVRYHGKCMEFEERNALFELEVRHVETLLVEAIEIYNTASLQEVDWMFNKADQFMSKFHENEIMDRRIADKVLILLGFIYLSSERMSESLEIELEEMEKSEKLVDILEGRKKVEAFSLRVHVPLMDVFGKQIDAYISRYGRRSLATLMIDNSLTEVLNKLK